MTITIILKVSVALNILLGVYLYLVNRTNNSLSETIIQLRRECAPQKITGKVVHDGWLSIQKSYKDLTMGFWSNKDNQGYTTIMSAKDIRKICESLAAEIKGQL